MKRIFPALLFILLACSYYLHLSNRTSANMDERVTMVVALGRFPPLAELLQKPDFVQSYLSLIDFGKYPCDSIRFKNVFQSVINDNSNASFYYFSVAALIKITGCGIWWPRALSIFLAGVNLYMIFILAGRFQQLVLFQWTSMIMVAVNPVFIYNAILVRSYMLALFGCLLSIFCLLRLLSKDKPVIRDYIFYFLAVLLAAGSHYFTMSILAAEFVFICLLWKTKKIQIKYFIPGYVCMVIITATWFYITYPVSWNNLDFLLKDTVSTAKNIDGFSLSFKNLVRQWMNISTYFFSISTDSMSKIRVLFKGFTTLLFFSVIFRLFRMRANLNYSFILTLIAGSMIFYTLQSFWEGQFINFIPKYLVFIIPTVILGINTALSGLVRRNQPVKNMAI